MDVKQFPQAMLTNNAEVRYSPSSSMEPTIHGSTDIAKADRLIIDKNAYQKQHPQREDIVMFAATKELQKQGYSENFVFRIVGLPGDFVEIKAGKLYINNQLDSPKYLDIKQTTTIDVCESGPQPPFLAKPVTIPSNHYLVMGDNRTQSYDGRCWGTVPKSFIVGKVSQILKFSTNK